MARRTVTWQGLGVQGGFPSISMRCEQPGCWACHLSIYSPTNSSSVLEKHLPGRGLYISISLDILAVRSDKSVKSVTARPAVFLHSMGICRTHQVQVAQRFL